MEDLPRSIAYPHLITIQRNLEGKPSLLPGKAQPYDTRTRSGKVIFYEFRGIGIPPEDVGRPGDVYWDVTLPYIVYVCFTANHWTPWNKYASSGSQLLAKHPCFKDRLLWIPYKTGPGLSWLSPSSFDTVFGITTGFALDYKMQESLVCLLRVSPSTPYFGLDKADNQRRHDAEVQRRILNGIPVADVAKPCIHLRRDRALVNDDDEAPALIGKNDDDARAETENLRAQVRTLRNEVQNLKSDNMVVEALLEEAGTRRRTEVENISRKLKRRYEEQSEAAVQDLVARHAQAEARIRELEKTRQDAVNEAKDLAQRLNKAKAMINVFKDADDERKIRLRKLAGVISAEIERAS
ncbi:hypothetical protein C8R44DRAFT_826243 [Mycena epipterygia]|nr:hypothetical protein C8R44DRAFT_826243 [Mycena epipterygia]